MNESSTDVAGTPTSFPLETNTLLLLGIVGAIALVFIGYLVIDTIRARREAKRLELEKRKAREAWQRETEL